MNPHKDAKLMKHIRVQRHTRLQNRLFVTAIWFEYIIAGIMIIALCIAVLESAMGLKTLFQGIGEPGTFSVFLKTVFDVVIGVEFLKMLCRHDLDSVVEVLLFAVARTLIVEHMSSVDILIGVIAIAVLFIIRKYMFISALDKQDDEVGVDDRGNEAESEHACNEEETSIGSDKKQVS